MNDRAMATNLNLLEQAINCNDGDRAAKIIQDALGITSRRLIPTFGRPSSA